MNEEEVLKLAKGDASFESPDVLEAARKRRHSKCENNSIQVLPSSIIANKKTSLTTRKQILL